MTDIATFLSLYPYEIKRWPTNCGSSDQGNPAAILTNVSTRAGSSSATARGLAKDSRYFAFLAPFDDYLKLGFEWGILIRDEANWLEGDGKQVRYFTLKPGEALDRAAAGWLPEGAVEVAHLTREQKTARLMEMEEEREAKGQTWNQSATN